MRVSISVDIGDDSVGKDKIHKGKEKKPILASFFDL